jgi:exopolysaccharide production protein ExoZ
MPQRFLPRIESMRGIAALTVVGFHVSNQFSAGPAFGWADGFAFWMLTALLNGFGAVVIFFVLSGFVLARSLDANSNPARFFRNRVFRLFPAAMFTVTLLTVLHWRFGFYVGDEASFDALNVVLNLLMIKSDINRVMWSMTVECVATPLILLSVWLFHKHGERPLWILVVVLIGLSPIGQYSHLLGGYTTLGPLYAFVVGVLIHFRGAQIASLIGPRLRTASIIAIAIFCFCGTRTQSALVVMLECLSAATLVILIAYRPMAGLFDPLDFQLSRFCGKISYSFYLLHLLGISFAARALALVDFPLSALPIFASTIVLSLLSILITTPVAYLSWRFVEVPAINFAKRNAGRAWFKQRLRPDRERLKHPLDTAGKLDLPPIADPARTPARVHRGSF